MEEAAPSSVRPSQTETTPFDLEVRDSATQAGRSRALVAGILGAIAALLALVAILLLSQPRPASSPQALVPAAVSPVSATADKIPAQTPDSTPARVGAETAAENTKVTRIRFSAKVVPPETTTSLDGFLIGRGDIDTRFSMDHKTHELVFQAPGYQAYRQVMKFDRDISFDISLERKTRRSTRRQKPRGDDPNKTETFPTKEEPPAEPVVKGVEKADIPSPPATEDKPAHKPKSDDIRAIDEILPW